MPHKIALSFALPSYERAQFAVSSRLLSCIVTESILRALYLPFPPAPSPPSESPLEPSVAQQAVGLCLILREKKNQGGDGEEEEEDDQRLWAVVPLRKVPILLNKQRTSSVSISINGNLNGEDGKRGSSWSSLADIGLIDPMDMMQSPFWDARGWTVGDVLTYKNTNMNTFFSLPNHHSNTPINGNGNGHDLSTRTTLDPLHFWGMLTDELGTDPELKEAIAEELKSSQMWQQHVYESPPTYPTLDSPSIQWEQSLIEGHPTHPMHRARRTLPPIPPITPSKYDFYNPHLRLLAAKRSKLDIYGDFEKLLEGYYELAERNAGRDIPEVYRNRNKGGEWVLVPVHELQVANILEKFVEGGEEGNVVVLEECFSVKALAQASIRSVIVPSALPSHSLKLPIGMKISSALRTVSHWTGDFGPRFSKLIVPHLTIDPRLLILETEPAGVVYRHEDNEVQKHFTVLIREAYENGSVERCNERVVVCAALLEMDPDGIPAVQAVLGLNTVEKRLEWFDKYVKMIFEAVLPPMLINGVAFEAHPQNMQARFDSQSGELLGFVVRDLGGLRIHPPTLHASTGIQFDFLPGHCIPTKTIQDAYKKLYHTLFHNHLQRLVRALDLDGNGKGWEVVRGHLRRIVPRESALWEAWLGEGSEMISGKCLLRMKLEGVYRDNVYYPMPNVIHFGERA